ncbi:hypothetical protein [Leucobacter denitrificans]|uniref:PH domain-containing protein n=1 Tax=Leucobacter denitrificans TaxID=683042 RepID=A0A7G9S5J8_9MICO|nr:hypothetical protein [Leucobacter denitrificans]QNN63123.1 hypothetical protein H9L06_01755 [Leucobacter denitrificans]
MNRITFLLIWIAIAAAIFTFMAIAWRARKRRDASLSPASIGLADQPIATFAHVSYVSTTPVGEPFVRVAVPGLSYKGWADVAVHREGVAIQVTGEPRIEISADRVRGTDTARGRIGKVVERDGISLLQWEALQAGSDTRALESGFRFDTPAEQRRFAAAISEMNPIHHTDLPTSTSITQEDDA